MKKSIIYIGIALLAVAFRVDATAQQPSPRQIYDNTSDVLHRQVYDDSVEIITYRRANSQEIRWRHNIRIGIGTTSLVATALFEDGLYEGIDNDYFWRLGLSDQLENQRYVAGPETHLPCLYAEYAYQVRPWLSIGGKSSIDAMWRAIYDTRTGLRVGNRDRYVVSAIANFRFDWLRRTNAQLYSSIGLGLAMRIEQRNNLLVPMFDATFIGLSVGRGFYCFWELGGGISGIARAGIGIRFNTKQR